MTPRWGIYNSWFSQMSAKSSSSAGKKSLRRDGIEQETPVMTAQSETTALHLAIFGISIVCDPPRTSRSSLSIACDPSHRLVTLGGSRWIACYTEGNRDGSHTILIPYISRSLPTEPFALQVQTAQIWVM